jgi:hypothetical protein
MWSKQTTPDLLKKGEKTQKNSESQRGAEHAGVGWILPVHDA